MFGRPTLVPRMDASAGSVLPTPTSQAAKHGATPDTTANAYGKNLWDLPHLLPTPTAVDMGRGKTVDEWDEWTDRMRAEHGNGNGHGRSLEIEAMKLLPTPDASAPGYTGPMVDRDGTPVEHVAQRCYDPVTGRLVQTGLSQAMRLLPTPTCQDGANNGGPSQFNRHALPLNTLVTTFHDSDPTPTPSPDGNPSSDDPHPTPPTTSDD